MVFHGEANVRAFIFIGFLTFVGVFGEFHALVAFAASQIVCTFLEAECVVNRSFTERFGEVFADFVFVEFAAFGAIDGVFFCARNGDCFKIATVESGEHRYLTFGRGCQEGIFGEDVDSRPLDISFGELAIHFESAHRAVTFGRCELDAVAEDCTDGDKAFRDDVENALRFAIFNNTFVVGITIWANLGFNSLGKFCAEDRSK